MYLREESRDPAGLSLFYRLPFPFDGEANFSPLESLAGPFGYRGSPTGTRVILEQFSGVYGAGPFGGLSGRGYRAGYRQRDTVAKMSHLHPSRDTVIKMSHLSFFFGPRVIPS